MRAYVNFVKATVGIRHEDELVKTIEILAQQLHPLAIGNVERFLQQSRMIARKILRTHMSEQEDHVIDEIVENMASKLYFHGHPINRREAKDDLRLKVVDDLPPELETGMWDLYLDFEDEFENLHHFRPSSDLARAGVPKAGESEEYELVHAMIESERQSSKHTTRRRFTVLPAMQAGQLAFQEDMLAQGWSHSMAQAEGSHPPRRST